MLTNSPNEPPADVRPKPVLPPEHTASAMDDPVIIRPSATPGYVEIVRCYDDVTRAVLRLPDVTPPTRENANV